MFQFADKPGADVALDIINTEPARSLSYVVLGPMTTFAQLIRKHGHVVRDRIGWVVSMGGALDVPGNTSAVAECTYTRHILLSYAHFTCRSQFLRGPLRGEGSARA